MPNENQNLELPKKVEIEKIENQKKSDNRKKNGGRRPGSGRKRIAGTVLNQAERREKMYSLIKENNNFESIVKSLIKKSKKNWRIAIWLVEQYAGKAPQTLKVGGDEDNNTPIGVIIMPQKK